MGEDCSSSIANFCKGLRGFTSHLESSCAALRIAVDQKPSSLPSQNLPSLLTVLIGRISSANQAVKRLESKTVNTISFQEILGHLKEIYKQNERSISTLEERLTDYGYTAPDKESFAEDIGEDLAESTLEFVDSDVKTSHRLNGGVSSVLENVHKSLSISSSLGENRQSHAVTYVETVKEPVENDSSFIETLSLQDLGLSAAGLACLALEEGSTPVVDYNTHVLALTPKETVFEESHAEVLSSKTLAKDEAKGYPTVSTTNKIRMLLKPVDENEYFNSPTWIKLKVSLEDLNNFVETICEFFVKKRNGCDGIEQGDYVLDQDDLSSLDEGDKVKPCLLFLVRLGRFRAGHENGVTVYHVVQH